MRNLLATSASVVLSVLVLGAFIHVTTHLLFPIQEEENIFVPQSHKVLANPSLPKPMQVAEQDPINLIPSPVVSAAPIDRSLKKCLVDGRVVYTDEVCPSHAERKDLDIKYSGGVQGVSRQLVNQTMARSQAQRDMENSSAAPRVSSLENPNKKNCDLTSQQIANLDSEARQPISGQRQDWIRAEKVRLNSLQSSYKC
jgi:hypothetical protein